MRVLITGAAGFIGAHALRYFADKHPEWAYVLIDRLNYAAALDRLAWLQDHPARAHIVHHDLAAPLPDQVVKRVGELDYVFHFAAETHVDRSLVDPEPFVQSNVVGTFNLLEFCRLHQPRLKMFFQVSTDEVYGSALGDEVHKEWAPHRPSNPYSATKAAAEDLCYAWEHSMGVPVIVTNTMNNVGPMQHAEKFVPRIIRALLRDDIITVHGSPGEPGSRKYLHARDHAAAIEFLMEHGRRGWRYNVVGAEEVTNLEMVNRVAALMGKVPKVRFVDFHATRPGHDRRYALDGGLMARMGWAPPTPLVDALRETIEFAKAHPEWL